MPDFLTPAESDKTNDQATVDTVDPEAPLYVPAEDVPEGIPADALASADVEAEETTTNADELPPVPLTTERALNIAFGAGLLLTEAAKIAAQKLGDQAEFVQNNAPAILDALEEKGKPVREAVLTKLKEAVGFGGGTFDGGESSEGDAAQTSGDVDAEQELPRPSASVDATFTPAPFVPPVGTSNGSAEAEISALERRVRELEQEVSKPLTVASAETPAVVAPAPVEPEYDAPDAVEVAQEITMEAGNEASETPADAATYDFASDAPESLADSDYAVSETPEEIVEESIENDYERAEGETGDKKDAG